MERLVYEKVNRQHIDIIYQWANDKTTRANAFHTEEIPYDDHVKWFNKKLRQDNLHFYIAKCKDVYVGQLRLDAENDELIISYSVAPEYRGNGFGAEILKYAVCIFEEEVCGGSSYNKLVGLVKHQNEASMRCFERLGFTKIFLEDYVRYEKNMYQS